MGAPEFVNQGPDTRFGGPVGHVFAWLQRRLSFHSTTAPFSFVWRDRRQPRRWKVGLEMSRPWLLPFLLVFLLRSDWSARPRWRSFRAGWRWDANWGIGGYIADVIVKGRIDNLVESVVLALCLVGLAGCAAKAPPPTVVRILETVEVKVPVPVARVPPVELLAPLQPPLPVFVAPAAAEASSALTSEGERLLRALINDLLARIAAWEAWARETP